MENVYWRRFDYEAYDSNGISSHERLLPSTFGLPANAIRNMDD